MSAKMHCFGSDSLALVQPSAEEIHGVFGGAAVDGSGLVSCYFSPTHSPNPSLAPPGERGGLHLAASLKVGNLCATARWPQSGGNPATSRCPNAKTSGYFPPLKTRPHVAVRSPFRPGGGGEGLGERGGIQRIKNENAADNRRGNSSGAYPCIQKSLQKQEHVTHMQPGLEVRKLQNMLATAQFTAASREPTK